MGIDIKQAEATIPEDFPGEVIPAGNGGNIVGSRVPSGIAFTDLDFLDFIFSFSQ